MGAVLISRNDLSGHDRGAAERMEEAVVRAVASAVGAFRVSIRQESGASEIVVDIEAHRPGDEPWRRELRVNPTLGASQLEARLLTVMLQV
jgi:hypothetical protein